MSKFGKRKTENGKRKTENSGSPSCVLRLLFSVLCLLSSVLCPLSCVSFAQSPDELEFNLEFGSPTVVLPKIYKSNIDLSGRGAHRDITLPQTIAAKEALDVWQQDLGFGNFYRIQYNLWEVRQLANDKTAQEKLLNNYDEIIKKISESGGIVILDLFGTPHGLGRVLDKNSAPHNLKEYKQLIKSTIRLLSCEKKYNIWYEVWNAPDIEDFFLGERSEYFALYRTVGEAVKELRQEAKIHIPLGGPSVSAWFKNIQPNNILSPEASLIYELIKYCYSYRLPLDFISWHAYSSDPQEDKQDTIYNKPFVKLIREWLTYFHFDSEIPLIVDEWNFDGAANISSKRAKDAYVCASYIPARLKNMYEAGIDYQTYFCLEDFGGSKTGVVTRNLGVFSSGRPKASYNIFRMLKLLGQDLFTAKVNDAFAGIIATKSNDYLALLIYNYIDPQAAMNYLSRNIVYLNGSERKAILNIIKSDRMKKILAGQIDTSTLRLGPKAKEMLKRALDLNNLANKFLASNRKIKISLKGPKDIYILNKYTIDNNCIRDCPFKATDDKDIDFNQEYVETIELTPYSVQLLLFKKKPLPAPEAKPEVKPEAEIEVKLEAKPEVKPTEKPFGEKPPEKTPEVKAQEKPAEAKPEIKKDEQPQDKTPAEGKKDAENK